MPIRITPAVKALLIACFGIFVVQQTSDLYLGGNVTDFFGLKPTAFVNQHYFWQVITYAFLHGDPMHLFLNLIMLVFIGGELEAHWGTARFVRYYFFCSISAGLLYLGLQLVLWRGDSVMVGASGALYGLLMAYGLIFGERVLLFMLLFPMKAKQFVWILAGIEFMTTVFSRNGGLSSAAHLGGMAAGFIYLWAQTAWSVAARRRAENRMLRGQGASKRKKGHLRLVTDRKPTSGDENDADHPKTWH